MPLGCPLIDGFPGRIIDPHHPAHLIVGLTSGVIAGFTNDLVIVLFFHVDQLRVTTGNQQPKHRVGKVTHEPCRVQVTGHVVDRHER